MRRFTITVGPVEKLQGQVTTCDETKYTEILQQHIKYIQRREKSIAPLSSVFFFPPPIVITFWIIKPIYQRSNNRG